MGGSSRNRATLAWAAISAVLAHWGVSLWSGTWRLAGGLSVHTSCHCRQTTPSLRARPQWCLALRQPAAVQTAPDCRVITPPRGNMDSGGSLSLLTRPTQRCNDCSLRFGLALQAGTEQHNCSSQKEKVEEAKEELCCRIKVKRRFFKRDSKPHRVN